MVIKRKNPDYNYSFVDKLSFAFVYNSKINLSDSLNYRQIGDYCNDCNKSYYFCECEACSECNCKYCICEYIQYESNIRKVIWKIARNTLSFPELTYFCMRVNDLKDDIKEHDEIINTLIKLYWNNYEKFWKRQVNKGQRPPKNEPEKTFKIIDELVNDQKKNPTKKKSIYRRNIY